MSLVLEKKVALLAVKAASQIAQKMQGSLDALDVLHKEDLSPVTVTDFCCQALINMHLSQHFPNDLIMGEEDSLFLRRSENELLKLKVLDEIRFFYPNIEESAILEAIDRGGGEGGKKGRFWTIDPIDGTKGFIRNDQYAVALALIEEGEVILGVLGCPRMEGGLVFFATKGEGAFSLPMEGEEETKLLVNPSLFSDDEVIYCEPHFFSTSHAHEKAYQIATRLKAHVKPFRLDSQVKYPLIAQNKASIYLRISAPYEEKIWDHAAGALIVTEAGGQVTDLNGDKLNFGLGKKLSHNHGIIASNGHLHDKIVSTAQEVLKLS